MIRFKQSRDDSLMNKTEFPLGVCVVVFSVLAILIIFSNVATVFVENLGQRFTFARNAKRSLVFMALVVVAGGVAVARYQGTRLGFVLGSAILLWSPFAFFLVMLTLNEPFLKRSLADELIWISFPLMVFILLGFGLVVDGKYALAHDPRTPKKNETSSSSWKDTTSSSDDAALRCAQACS